MKISKPQKFFKKNSRNKQNHNMFTSFSTYFLIFWLCQIFKEKEVALLFMNWHFQSCFFRYDSKMCGWLRHDSNHRPENSVRIRTIQLHQDVLGPLGHLLSRRLSRSMLRFDSHFGQRCALFRTLSHVLHSIEAIIEQWTCPQK